MTTITSLCVFCGSKTGHDPAYARAAETLARQLCARGVRLIYGGGGIGIMGRLTEAVLQGGGKVTGVIPEFLLQYEVGNPDIDELIVVESMHERKRTMFERADGFVIMPGGLGTLDEAFEILTWKQLQLHKKPIVLVNVGGYWDPFAAMIDAIIDSGFAHPAAKELISIVDGVDDIFEAMARQPEPKEIVLTDHL